MSETKTLYTMYQIKEAVKDLRHAALDEFNKRLLIKVEEEIENNIEMQLELKKWETYSNELNALEKKYENSWTRSYRNHVDGNRLKYCITKCFEEKLQEEKNKIYAQFEAILNKLSSMRKPDAALEFLKLCGIELPEKVKLTISIPVDPDFIKSVLPKQQMLAEGSGDAE